MLCPQALASGVNERGHRNPRWNLLTEYLNLKLTAFFGKFYGQIQEPDILSNAVAIGSGSYTVNDTAL